MLIFLVGFMGSGKTTVGKALAKELDLKFYDTDELIEKSLEMSVSQIFEVYGEAYFRLSEYDILKVIDLNTDAIVATGGGLPMVQTNMDFLRDNGMVIYLDCNEDVLLDRLEKGKATRPAIKNLKKTDLKYFIKSKLKERSSHYEKAHMIYKINTETDPVIKELKDYLSLFL